MSETKFTPGPWNLGAGILRIYDASNEEVAVATRASPKNRYAAPANAALIAAAPELYAALDKVLNHSLTHLSGDVEPVVRAALSKARGEAS